MAEKIDRQTDGTNLVNAAKAATDGRPYLGSKDDVERIVRTFATGVLERFDEVGSGVLTPLDASQADESECLKMGVVFTGGDEAYAPMPGWTGQPLAEYLRNSMETELVPDDDDAKIVAQAFAVFVHRLYDHLRSIATMAEAELMMVIEKDCQDLTLMLIGVQRNG